MESWQVFSRVNGKESIVDSLQFSADLVSREAIAVGFSGIETIYQSLGFVSKGRLRLLPKQSHTQDPCLGGSLDLPCNNKTTF